MILPLSFAWTFSCDPCMMLIVPNEEYFGSPDKLPERSSNFNSMICFSAVLHAVLEYDIRFDFS